MNTIYIPVNKIRHNTRRENADIVLAVIGVAICFALSILLSNLWEYSGRFIIAAIFSAVNKSVWESVKIICLPMLLWFAAEYFILHVNYYRLAAAAAVGTLTAAVVRICTAFVCTGILGFCPQWLDLCLTALSLAVGQWSSVRIQRYPGRVEEYFLWSAAALGVLLYALMSFTVNPPHIGLFIDPVSGIYGMG